MPAAKLHIDKIDHKTKPHSICQIAGNTGEEQCEGTHNAVVGARRPPKEIKHEMSPRQKPRPRVPIARLHRCHRASRTQRPDSWRRQNQKAGNYRPVTSKRKDTCRPSLGGLVDHKYATRNGEVGKFPEKIFLSHFSVYGKILARCSTVDGLRDAHPAPIS